MHNNNSINNEYMTPVQCGSHILCRICSVIIVAFHLTYKGQFAHARTLVDCLTIDYSTLVDSQLNA